VLEENLAQVHQLISSLFCLCYNIVKFYYQQQLLPQPCQLKREGNFVRQMKETNSRIYFFFKTQDPA